MFEVRRLRDAQIFQAQPKNDELKKNFDPLTHFAMGMMGESSSPPKNPR